MVEKSIHQIIYQKKLGLLSPSQSLLLKSPREQDQLSPERSQCLPAADDLYELAWRELRRR
jgi:hypothetical protein